MKEIKQGFSIIDDEGVGVPGKEVWFYPIGTTSHGTKADEVPGKPGQYVIVIDPTGDNSKISHYYDIWYDGSKQYSKVTLKDKWLWFCTKSIDSADKTINFVDCDDENGESLPTTIPNAILGLMSFSKGRLFYISNQSTTQFTIKAQDWANDDCVNLATNPVNVTFFVTVKAIKS